MFSVCQCQNWFSKFRSDSFDLNDTLRLSRPIETDDDKIKSLQNADRSITTRGIVEKLNLSNLTIHDHLKRLGFVSKLTIWIPHNLKEIDSIRRITICYSLLKSQENDPFFKRIITGDEKWIVYNIKRKRSWSRQNKPAQSTSKIDIHQRKIIFFVW